MTEKEFIDLLKYAGYREPYTNMKAEVRADEIYFIFESCKKLSNNKIVPVSVIYNSLNEILAAAK